MTPQQSNSPGRGSPFSRYSGEQVQQIPAGYMEGMSSWGRMAQGLGSNIANMMSQQRQIEFAEKELTAKTSQTNIDARKAAASEENNRLKELGISNDAVHKAYQSTLTAEDSSYNRTSESLKSITALKASAESIIRDPDATPEAKASATKELEALNPQQKTAMQRMAEWSGRPIPTVEDVLKKFHQQRSNETKAREAMINEARVPPLLRKPALEQPISNSFYNSPAFNPSALTGEPQNATKTVAFGGSAKKVEVVGGLVSSVVKPDGSKVALSGSIKESDLPSAVEFASTFGEPSSSPSSSDGTEAETPATEAPAAIERIELPGPLNKTYLHTEPMQAIRTSMTKDTPVSGTVVFEEKVDSFGTKTRTPIVKYNSKALTDASGNEVPEAVQNFRRLSMVSDVLESGDYKDIVPTPQEREEARDLLGTEENAFDLPSITKAYALVSRNIKGGQQPYSTAANLFGIRFDERYGLPPSQFIANGDRPNEREIVPSTSVILEKTEQARIAERLQAVGTAPEKPPSLQISIDNVKTDIEKIEKRIKFVGKELAVAPADSDLHKRLKAEEASLSLQLKVLDGKQTNNNTLLANFESANRRHEARLNAVKEEVGIDLAAQQLASGKLSMAEKVEARLEGWIGVRPTDYTIANGFVAKGLRNIRGLTYNIPVLGKDGKPTGKFIKDRLDAPEAYKVLKRERQFDTIMELSEGMPNDKNINDPKSGILVTQTKYNEALYPLNELNRMNEVFLGFTRKGLKGEAQASWEKMWFGGDPSMAGAATFQKALVGKIREAIVGPGNPSNYEQEVINSIVPNPTDLLSRPARQKARIQALAMMAMLDHYTKMTANKLEPSEETFKAYNSQLGAIMGQKITPDMFAMFVNDYTSTRTAYSNRQAMGAEDVSVAKQYATRLIDTLEARVSEKEGK
jgi:hypothetical protein